MHIHNTKTKTSCCELKEQATTARILMSENFRDETGVNCKIITLTYGKDCKDTCTNVQLIDNNTVVCFRSADGCVTIPMSVLFWKHQKDRTE